MERATRWQLGGVAGLVGVALLGTVLVRPGRLLAMLEALSEHPLQFALVLTVCYLLRGLFLWPVSLFSLVLGYLYDPLLAIPVALLGAGLTCLLPFALARHAPTARGPFASLASSGERVADAVGETRGTIAARVAPIPGDAVSYTAGLSNISVGAFVLGTVLGEIPWTLAAVAAGNSMRSLSVEGLQLDPTVALGMAGLATIMLWRPISRHLLKAQLTD